MALTAFLGVHVNNFQNVLFVYTLIEKFDRFFCTTVHFCHVDFSFKTFDKSINKGNFLKIINLYCQLNVYGLLIIILKMN
jgi:hypothetical protein